MPTCVFCGFSGKLTGEHGFGDWLFGVGANIARRRATEPAGAGAGPAIFNQRFGYGSKI
jgi:hypothetical protein